MERPAPVPVRVTVATMSSTVDQADAVRVLVAEIFDCEARPKTEPDGERRTYLNSLSAGYAERIAVYVDAADGWPSMRPESWHGIRADDYPALKSR